MSYIENNTSGHKSRKRGLSRVLVGVVPLFVFLIIAAALMGSFYVVNTGNVAVERTMGKVDMTEVQPGLNFKMPFFTTSYEFSGKEISIDLEDLRPKAADNLSLKDLDVSVYYRVNPGQMAEVMVKYNDAAVRGEESLLPAYRVVFREARGAIYESVSEIESLQLHRQREALQVGIAEGLQNRLEGKDPGVFEISRVVVRALNTDPSIEASIRSAVQNQKKLEAKRIEVEIAQKDAEIEIERARGIAQANAIINASLTAEYLQHEVNMALQQFADNDGSVVIMPANMQGFDLILDQSSLKSGGKSAAN